VSGTGVNETYVYDGDGKRVRKTSAAGTVVFAYENAGADGGGIFDAGAGHSAVWQDNGLGDCGGIIGNKTQAAMNRGGNTSEAYPSGRVVNTCYDGANRVSQVGSTCGNAIGAYASNIQYAAHREPWFHLLGNGVEHAPNYNSRLQVCGIQDVLAGSLMPALCGNATVTGGTSLLNATLNWGSTQNNGNLQGASYLHSGGGLSQPADVFAGLHV
jgi:YD repeat-containing protein